ncbi:MAG TPA: TssA family type VI secretion system protein, partial [Ignavibacteriaceae bacterium]|nr:TssA family type VI secretion system protein [Ignavibacteriaceae bacterium]
MSEIQELASQSEMEISELVQGYLDPIPGNSPAGNDASGEEEYFKLNMEIPKTAPDYKKCIEFSEIILKEKSKDIKVAAWLCFALFRTEKIKGLNDGLGIIYHLLKKYENNLFPANPLHRSKAIQFINTSRFFKLLEKEDINRSNASYVIESEKIISQIEIECGKLFPDNFPVLKSLKEIIESHAEKAKSLTAPQKKEVPVNETITEEKSESKIEVTPSGKIEEIQKTQPVNVSSGSTVKEIKLTNEKDAVAQLRQVLTFFFENPAAQGDAKKEKIPDSVFVFGLGRQLQWSNIIRPPDADRITQIEAPNQVIRGKMKEWFAAGNWETIIPRIEISFLKANSEFPFWLDAQRYVVKALEQKGGIYNQAAEDIKIHLARLLQRIPDLPQLIFKDKQTPFADDETIRWINEEVKTSISGGKGTESIILPPIMGEDYGTINKEYESACNELPENFEKNISEMQKGISSDIRKKGKFL